MDPRNIAAKGCSKTRVLQPEESCDAWSNQPTNFSFLVLLLDLVYFHGNSTEQPNGRVPEEPLSHNSKAMVPNPKQIASDVSGRSSGAVEWKVKHFLVENKKLRPLTTAIQMTFLSDFFAPLAHQMGWTRPVAWCFWLPNAGDWPLFWPTEWKALSMPSRNIWPKWVQRRWPEPPMASNMFWLMYNSTSSRLKLGLSSTMAPLLQDPRAHCWVKMSCTSCTELGFQKLQIGCRMDKGSPSQEAQSMIPTWHVEPCHVRNCLCHCMSVFSCSPDICAAVRLAKWDTTPTRCCTLWAFLILEKRSNFLTNLQSRKIRNI